MTHLGGDGSLSQYGCGRGLPVSPEASFPPCAARRALRPDRCAGASRKADAHRRVARPGRRVDGGRVDQDVPPRRHRSNGSWRRLPARWTGFPEGYVMSEETAPPPAATGYAAASGASLSLASRSLKHPSPSISRLARGVGRHSGEVAARRRSAGYDVGIESFSPIMADLLIFGLQLGRDGATVPQLPCQPALIKCSEPYMVNTIAAIPVSKENYSRSDFSRV